MAEKKVYKLSDEKKRRANKKKNGSAEKKSGASHEVGFPPNPMPNARLFMDSEFKADNDRYLLVYQGGQFYEWDTTCWPLLEDRKLRSRLYTWFESAYVVTGEGKTRPFAPTQGKINSLTDAIKAIVHADADLETPAWLSDNVVDAAEVISCANGLVHWPTRTIYHHSPEFYVHHSVPFDFDPAAPEPEMWLEFLGQLWGHDDDAIVALQELFGYLISGETRQQKLFMLVGPKRAGKGTIARVLTALLGRHNVAGPTLAGIGTNFGLQDLIGKPVAIVSDARIGSKTDVAVIAERLLSISGEDLQNVDRKFKDPWSGYLPTRFLILTNELPRFADASGALSSRFIVLMLTNNFYGREDPALTDSLCSELGGIFNWALDGLDRLKARGYFLQPGSGASAIQEMEDLASPVGAFIRDQCVLGAEHSIDTSVLYGNYKQWAENNGHPRKTESVFGRDLRSVRPEVRKARPRIPGARKYTYFGIKLMGIYGDHLDRGDQGHKENGRTQPFLSEGSSEPPGDWGAETFDSAPKEAVAPVPPVLAKDHLIYEKKPDEIDDGDPFSSLKGYSLSDDEVQE